jgi:hypothetical protein
MRFHIIKNSSIQHCEYEPLQVRAFKWSWMAIFGYFPLLIISLSLVWGTVRLSIDGAESPKCTCNDVIVLDCPVHDDHEKSLVEVDLSHSEQIQIENCNDEDNSSINWTENQFPNLNELIDPSEKRNSSEDSDSMADEMDPCLADLTGEIEITSVDTTLSSASSSLSVSKALCFGIATFFILGLIALLFYLFARNILII